MREVQGIFSKTATRDRFRQSIYDFLYDDRTGLPVEQYSEEDLIEKTDRLFRFFERSTQTVSPQYEQQLN
jgi:type I restriction enzyme R subunit